MRPTLPRVKRLLTACIALALLLPACRQPTENAASKKTSTARASVSALELAASELSGPDTTLGTRRVWVYLPTSYASNPERRYPVLYLFDGQNLFDDSTSFVGEWGIDETLDSLGIDLIVVGLDHGNARRSFEYTPYRHSQDTAGTNTGLGAQTVAWLTGSVMPWAQATYRTSGRSFVGGASLGGLMALYAELKHPDTFDGALDFSPAYWVNDPAIYELASRAPATSRVYQLAGYREGSAESWGAVVRDMQRMDSTLAAAGVAAAQRTAVMDSLGEHNEKFWRRRFAEGIRWLLAEPSR